MSENPSCYEQQYYEGLAFHSLMYFPAHFLSSTQQRIQ